MGLTQPPLHTVMSMTSKITTKYATYRHHSGLEEYTSLLTSPLFRHDPSPLPLFFDNSQTATNTAFNCSVRSTAYTICRY